jgi:purine-binding chemotaxis protein CheW
VRTEAPDTLPAEEAEDSIQLVTFNLGEELFALDILKVQEIIRVSPITPVPHCPDYVDGVITLRGKIVPIIDLRTRFGLSPAEHGTATRIIVINVKQIMLGLVVDAVHEVTRLGRGHLESTSTMGGGTNDYVSGVGKLGGQLVTLVDVESVGTPIGAAAC